MAIYLSEKFKQFRKNLDLTQEQIADIFNVTPQTVSRWETGTNMPDIEMLPALAEFFKVTVDDLLGVDIMKNQQRINKITEQLEEKHHKGLTDDAIKICRNALKEFPNNCVLLSKLAHFLRDKACATPAEEEKRKYFLESVSISERILIDCTNDDIRWESIQSLAYGYNDLGETEKAIEITKKLPHFIREIVYATVCGENERLKAKSDNIKTFGNMVAFDLVMFASRKDANKSIALIKKAVAIMEILFENGDYGPYNDQLSFNYQQLAQNYMRLNDFDGALDCIEKSASYAIAYDALPEDFKYTSIAVADSPNEKIESVKNYDSNSSYLLLHGRLTNNLFDPIRDSERFKAVIAKLAKYAIKET